MPYTRVLSIAECAENAEASEKPCVDWNLLNFKSVQIEMGEVDAKRERVTRYEHRHDQHTVSLLTDHLVFSPKYRGKVLEGEVAEVAEEIVRENCKERDNEVIDMAVNVNY